jgi:hypothetical protein
VPEDTSSVATEEAGRVLADLAELRRETPPMPMGFVLDRPPLAWVPQAERFDANRYFEAFDRLRLAEGWQLDYVYNYHGIGGEPWLYARRAADPPLDSLDAYRARFPNAGTAAFLGHLVSDRTPEAAFQLALFALEAPKFYLNWHSHYFDTELICTAARREEILAGIPLDHGPFGDNAIPAAERARLREVPLAPVVRRAGDFVEVETLAFTKWGGFFRRTVRLAWPNWVLNERREEVVAYQCGIMI